MIFFKDLPLNEVNRLARYLVLATVLAAPILGEATLQTPRRPGAGHATLSSTTQSRQIAPPRSNRTYLAMVGPSALNFADPEPTLPPEPVMPDPPKPKPNPASVKTETRTTVTPGTGDSTATPITKPDNPIADPGSTPANNGPTPITLLPDDTQREIRAEEVLPFFQFPSSSAGDSAPTVIINPAPATAPPSSATYRQQ